MYPNIDPKEGIPIVQQFIKTYHNDLPSPLSNNKINFLITLLRIVMSHNIFQFGDTYWVQQIGTAMGTPVACIYATIFFAWFEKQYLLPKYKDNLLLYVRQIDDILGIWIDSPFNEHAWTDFQNDVQSRCKLDWKFTPPSKLP